jgi:NTP pyrophosphatase (non-canonical NTP hydrolase)
MEERFNELSAAEEERLHLLMEEMGEAIQAAAKILRHGYRSYNPDDPKKMSNRTSLERELGDVFLAVSLMAGENDISNLHVSSWKQIKSEKVTQYLHHQ